MMRCIATLRALGISFLFTTSALGQNVNNSLPVLTRNGQEPNDQWTQNFATEEVQMTEGFGASPDGGVFMHAKIDHNLVLAPNYGAQYDPTEFNEGVNTSLTVGTPSGSHGVSPTGAATYYIPIQVPPGTGGLGPNLAINYSNQAGNGLLGMGWNLSGISAISRVSKTNYRDGDAVGVQLDDTDVYALDGNRLIRTGSSPDGSGGTFDTEVITFSEITSIDGPNGAEQFVVKTKEGLTLSYGGTMNSRLHDHTNSTVIVYYLSWMGDAFGNYMNFDYVNENDILHRQCRISKISYGGTQDFAPYNEVQFEYVGRNDPSRSYVAGTSVKSNYLLKKIRVLADGQGFKNYTFNYASSELGLHTLLKSVMETGANGEALNPIKFLYGEQTSMGTTYHSNHSVLLGEPQLDRFYGDFNGDGLTDIMTAVYGAHIETWTTPWCETAWNYYLNGGGSSDPECNGMSIVNYCQCRFEEQLENNNNIEVTGYNDCGEAYAVGPPWQSDITVQDMVLKLYLKDGPDGGFVLADTKSFETDEFDIFAYGSPAQIGGVPMNGTSKSKLLLAERKPTKNGVDPSGRFTTVKTVTYSNGNLHITTTDIPDDPCDIVSNIPGNNFLIIGDFLGQGDPVPMIFVKNGSGVPQAHLTTNLNQISMGVEEIEFIADADNIKIVDFNGDGKSDIMAVNQNLIKIFSLYQNGNTVYTVQIYSSGFPNVLYQTWPGDFNGDGLTDLLAFNSPALSWELLYSDGIGFNSVPFSFTAPLLPVNLVDIKIGDFNGDGMDDINQLYTVVSEPTTYANIYYSKGFSFQEVNHTYSDALTLTPAVVGEFNGDGKPDLFCWKGGSAPFKILYFNKDKTDNYLKSVKNGMGERIDFTYTWLTKWENYESIGHGMNNTVCVSQPIPVVRSLTTQDGLGGTNTAFYNYKGAFRHTHGKGFLGFGEITTANQILNRKTETVYAYNLGHHARFVRRDNLLTYADEPLISRENFDHFWSPGNGRYWMAIDDSRVTDHKTGFENRDLKQFNNDGNVTQHTVIKGYGTANSHTTTTDFSSFVATAGSSVPNRAEEVSVEYARNGVTRIRTTANTYDIGTGALLQSVADPATEIEITTDFAYNTYGNVTSETISASGLQNRITSYVYDPKGRFPVSKTNSLGQTETFEYDSRWGKVTQATTVGGLTTSSTYDMFGRINSTTDALGVTSIVSRDWDTDPGNSARFHVTTSTTGLPDATTYYDILGRSIKSVGEGFEQTLTTTKSFDERGRLAESTSVTSSSGTLQPYTTIPTYNSLDQVQSISDGEKTITSSYSNNGDLYTTTAIETSHPDNPTAITRTDASGLVRYTEDEEGSLTFTYDPYGNQNTVTDQSGRVLVNSVYDIFGRQESLTDINGGTTEYTYDAFGQLEYQKDALGNETTITYDVAGRVETKTVAGEASTTYEYVTSGNGLNKLKRVTAPNGTYTEYTYDEYNRPKTVTKGIDGKSFTKTLAYATTGELATSTYPTESGTPLTLSYNYDPQMGAVTSLSGNGALGSIYSLTSVNGLGGITQYELGNGLSTVNSFTDRGQLSTSTTGALVDMAYDWNPNTGVLDTREYLTGGYTEDFEHDALGRLTRAEVVATGGFSNVVPPVIEVAYEPNGNGNFNYKSDVGTLEYHDDKINAVKSITNEDENISLEQQDLTYTSTDRTATIHEGLHHIAYTYGPDDNRLKSVLTVNEYGNNGSQHLVRTETRYYLGNYEQLIIDYADGSQDRYELNYIISGPGLVGIFVKHNEDAGTMFYTYTDHLGSITHLTDDQGNLVYRQSFDAWGRSRNPDGLTYTAENYEQPELPADMPDPAIWLNRGYTGHEHLDEFDLVNMNNRMYDPKQGRMLAVDNFVQSPYSSQGYNRYSYVLNSPLSYVDPTGEYIADYLNDAIAANSWDPYGWGRGEPFDGTIVVGITYGGNGFNVFAGGSLDASANTYVVGGNPQQGTFGGGVSPNGVPAYVNPGRPSSFSIDWRKVNQARGKKPDMHNFNETSELESTDAQIARLMNPSLTTYEFSFTLAVGGGVSFSMGYGYDSYGRWFKYNTVGPAIGIDASAGVSATNYYAYDGIPLHYYDIKGDGAEYELGLPQVDFVSGGDLNREFGPFGDLRNTDINKYQTESLGLSVGLPLGFTLRSFTTTVEPFTPFWIKP